MVRGRVLSGLLLSLTFRWLLVGPPDEQIDTSDIPELSPDARKQAVRGRFFRPTARRRSGFLAGQLSVPADFDEMGREEIERMFEGVADPGARIALKLNDEQEGIAGRALEAEPMDLPRLKSFIAPAYKTAAEEDRFTMKTARWCR